jgi:hypothetical protein
MATSLTLENDSSLAQGYIKVNGSTAATLTTSGITANLTGNVTGNADTATKFSTTTGSAPAYACRAWVNFDGTRDTTGAVSTANTNRLIRASGNVTSVLRNGLGDYTITFTTPMSDADYVMNASSSTSSIATVLATISSYDNTVPRTVNNIRIQSMYINANNNKTLWDDGFSNVAIFGN